MKNQTFFTREDLHEILDQFSVSKGSHVCVQASDAFCQLVWGQAQMILDVLMERIGESGCLFMPSFSFSNLDPACWSESENYENWELIREHQRGYSLRLSPCDSQGMLANQFLRNEKVVRTEHPVYSFAFWGKIQDQELLQKNNYPLSFTHVLSSFARQHAINLLFDVEPTKSVLLPAIAKTLNKGCTSLQRAIVRKGKNRSVKTYLVIDVPDRESLLEYCYQKKIEMKKKNFWRLTLDEIEGK